MQIEIAVSLIREIPRSSFALLKLTFIFVEKEDGRGSTKQRVSFLRSKISAPHFPDCRNTRTRTLVNFEKLQSLFIVPTVFLCTWNFFSLFIYIYLRATRLPRQIVVPASSS